MTLGLMLFCFSVLGQDKIWHKSSSNGQLNAISINHLDAENFNIFTLNFNAFKQSLANAPLRDGAQTSSVVISVPDEKGKMENFTVFEAPVFDEQLSAQYPEIKSYVGFNQIGTRLRMSVSPSGVQTMISYIDKPTVFMQPVNGDTQKYIVYNRDARGERYDEDFVCSTIDTYSKLTSENAGVSLRDANDQLLRKFRLAMSVNGEYTQFHGGTVASALAAINATITRVNEVFETDMAVTFVVIDAPQIIFTNALTDPYSNNLGQWNAQLQNTLNNTVGNAAYDIGHMFGASGGGGSAGCIGCVCVDNQKGSGKTSPADGIPQGDNFDIDYVAHEIGHQMGANHTFAFSTEGTGVNAEPGSGSTVMGYAGITGPDDVQQHSDPYFHYYSIKQILDNLVARTCWQANSPVAITNGPPSANAGADYIIPKGTAYILKGSATDANGGDVLTYCWEQTNSGAVSSSNFGPNLTVGSTNRSLPPTTSPDRFIPKINRVVAGQLTQTNPTLNSDWETVSNVARPMGWALTVRDRMPTAVGLNGQSSYDLTNITVNGTAGPFVVTSQSTVEIWSPGESKDITWNIASTNIAPVNTANVNILLSTDGGFTYPIVLLSNTPNDGSQAITVPTLDSATNMARVKVEAVGNIYYAISPINFNVTSTNPEFFMTANNSSQTICGVDSIVYNFDYTIVNGFNETATFSATGNPAGTTVVFTPASLNTNGSYTMTINNLNSTAAGTYNVTVTGTSTSITRTAMVTFTKLNGACSSVANTTYQTSTTGVTFNTIDNLNTGKPSGYSDYTAISTDANRESSYPLTVKVNTDGNYLTRTTVWIDWNQNCSFADAGEEYDLGTATNVSNGNTGNSPLSITIPADAVLGSTIMRVSTKYSSSPTSCENGADAEVEDYSVNVLETLSVDEFGNGNFAIYPNPNSGEFTVSLNSSSSDKIMVTVYDIRGRKIYDNKFQNASNFNQTINLNVHSGMYLVMVSDGDKQATKKIIVE
ncbi:MAG TPA: zinc-dependent metalloprotease family protein [Aquaticitalea sp.]|nr:zinc-dependent metalloprotease family protein [Aquaticitalea sp.]